MTTMIRVRAKDEKRLTEKTKRKTSVNSAEGKSIRHLTGYDLGLVRIHEMHASPITRSNEALSPNFL